MPQPLTQSIRHAHLLLDPDACHGHKTQARGFDGSKGHVAIDPETEIITNTVVRAANAGDASVAGALIEDLLNNDETAEEEAAVTGSHIDRDGGDEAGGVGENLEGGKRGGRTVYGDAAYGTGEFLDHLANADIDSRCKTQPPTAPETTSMRSPTPSTPDPERRSVGRHPPKPSTSLYALINKAVLRRPVEPGHGTGCAFRGECTSAKDGRSIRVGRYEQRLAEARRQSRDPGWVADYRATRPKVERKLGHLMRRRHGGCRARVRGKPKVDADFNLLAAAQNVARLAVLGLVSTPDRGWAVAT